MVVYEKMIERHIMAELPFMMTENIIMEAVKKGGDRQALHEAIRVHSMEAGAKVKVEGLENDLIDRIVNDPIFKLTKEDLSDLMTPAAYIGRCPEQVDYFIEHFVTPIRNQHADALNKNVTLRV
jgi:adenylosuccinate lyase